MATQSVRINTQILERVRKQIGDSRQPVSAFIEIVMDNVLTQLENEQIVMGYSLKTDAVKKMDLLTSTMKKWSKSKK